MKLFELEEDIHYYCSVFATSQVFKIEDNMLRRLSVDTGKWEDYPVIDLRWEFIEIPDQKNKCPRCHRSMMTKKGAYVFMNRFYTGLYCTYCKITVEGPDVPKLGIVHE